MTRRLRHAAGFSLVELMVTLTVLGFLLLAVMPSVTTWVRNTQIRTAAESIMSGLGKARTEAVKRNSKIRLSLVSSFSSSCTLSSTSGNWIVSQTSPAGLCDVDPSDSTAPQTVEKSTLGDANGVTVAIKSASGTGPCGTASSATFAEFDGYGRMTSTTPQLRCIVVDHSIGSGNRALNILVSPGGNVRLCDPAVSSSSDPRKC